MKQILHCIMQVQNLVTLILTIAFLHLAITGKVAAGGGSPFLVPKNPKQNPLANSPAASVRRPLLFFTPAPGPENSL